MSRLRPPSFLRLDPACHRIARSLFLRGIGLIRLVAIPSSTVEVPGLAGRDDPLPAGHLLRSVAAAFESREEHAFFALPMILWLTGASDPALQGSPEACSEGSGSRWTSFPDWLPCQSSADP